MKQQVFTTHGSLPPKEATNYEDVSAKGDPRNMFLSHNIQTFLDEVSIGGVKYVVIPKASFIRRTIWLVMVLAGIGFCIYQIADRVSYYMSRPTTVNIHMDHVSEIRFPTVTLCNENRMIKSRAMEYGGSEIVDMIRGLNPPLNARVNMEIFDHIDPKMLQGQDWGEVFKYFSQDIDEAVISCEYDGKPCSIEDFESVATNIGFCWQFNSVKHNFTTKHAGGTSGLKVVLGIQQSEYLAPVKGSVAAGFRVALHDPHSVPLMREWAFRVDPGQQTLVAVNAHQVIEPGLPYVNCSTDPNYSYTECLLECETNYTVDNCSCKAIHMKANVSLCDPQTDLLCMVPAQERYIAETMAERCFCPRQCNSTIYKYSISSASASDFYMDEMSKIIANEHGHPYEPIRASIHKEYAMLEIFFSEMAYEKMTSQAAYSPLALLCDIGGALGLILGSTLLTVFEVVDFIMVALWHSCTRKKTKIFVKE